MKIKQNTNVHEPDLIFNNFWKDSVRFADFINAAVFDGEQVITPESLKDIDTKSSNIIELKTGSVALVRTRDVVKKSFQGIDFVIIGIESQKLIHYGMPLRAMLYDGLSYLAECQDIEKHNKTLDETVTKDEFLSKLKKTDRIHPAITVVIYYGDKAWDGPLSLKDMFVDMPEKVLNAVSDYKMNLVEVRSSGELKFSSKELEIVFNISRNFLNGDIEAVKSQYGQQILSPEQFQFIGQLTRARNLKIFNQPSRKEDITMCKALENLITESTDKGIAQGIAEGKVQGIAEGKAQGIAEGKTDEQLRIATSLLDVLDDDTIALKTGVPLEKVQSLRKQNG